MAHIPRKRFGQHFLCDQTIIDHIVSALAPNPNEHLVEIGPGQGALTFPVLQQSQSLEVIELDRDLIPLLKRKAENKGILRIHEADVLNVDLTQLKTDARLLRVFGNLPYNISTPLIFHLLDASYLISDMVFMLQKEVADRLAARPSTPDYGRLSVMVQYQCQVQVLFDVPPTAFDPPPKVNSAIVKLIPYVTLPYEAKDVVFFSTIVKQAFGQRRKTLRNSLKGLISDEMWAKMNIASDRRPETLSVQEFVEMSNACQSMR